MMVTRPTLLRLAVFLITLAVFARLTTCSFSWWDDQDTIRQNRWLNPPTWETLDFYWNMNNAGEQQTMGLYVPVTYTVWAGLAKIGHLNSPDAEGLTLNPFVFHSSNVVIHAVTAVVVFELLFRLFGRAMAAFCGAILFAVHPVQVETVGWISGTKDLLCGLLSSSALLMYVRSVQMSQAAVPSGESGELRPADVSGPLVLQYAIEPARRWPARWRYLLGMLLFVLAMLAKPTGVVTPLMAAAGSVFLLNRSLGKTVISLLPWFVLMIPCLIWTQKFQPAEWADPLPVWARGGVALDALAFYFFKLLWPSKLCIDYGHNPAAILANHSIYITWVVPVTVVLTICWVLFPGRSRKLRSPVGNGNIIRQERGLSPFLSRTWIDETGASAHGYQGPSTARVVVAAVLLFVIPLLPVLGFVPFEFQMVSTTADHYLYLPMFGVSILLAWAMIRMRVTVRGDHYARLTTALVVFILTGLAIRSILQESVWQDSRTLFLHTLAVNPRSTKSLENLGFLAGRDARRLADEGRVAAARPLFDESIDWYQQALKAGPTSIPTMYNLALNYQQIGRDDLALKQIQHMVQLQPEISPGLRADPIHLAKLLVEFGDTPGAIAWLNQVIARDPSNLLAMAFRARMQERLNHSASTH